MTLDELRPIIRFWESRVMSTVNDLVRNGDFDTIREWFLELIKSNPACCLSLGLPRSRSLEALRTLLRSDSAVAASMSRLLAERLSIYLVLIPELSKHPFASSPIRELHTKLQFLFSLVRRSGPAPRTRNVEVVLQAMEAGDLSVFKDSLVDTDLWVVLKTVYESTHGPAELRQRLYDFVFKQLRLESDNPGSIPQERHAWWAIVTLLNANYEAFQGQGGKRLLEDIIVALLSRPEPRHRSVEQIIRSSPVPELYSEEREQLLVGNNLCYLLASSYSLSPELHSKLRNRLEAIAEKLTSKDETLFKIVCSYLWFAYNLALYLTSEETEQLANLPRLDWNKYRVGNNYYSLAVVSQVKEMLNRGESLLKNPSTWTSPTLSAGLICGAPGQGKTDLMGQIVEEMDGLVTESNRASQKHILTVGEDITTEADFEHLLKELDKKSVNIVVIDELDKAPFNLQRMLLGPLENASHSVEYGNVFWLFGQSSYETFDDYKNAAQQIFTQNKDASLRDFLTRLKWGVVEIPDIRFVPVQRVLSAVGMMRSAGYSCTSIDTNWVRHIAQDTTIDTNRELRRKAMDLTTLDDGCLCLKSNGAFDSVPLTVETKRWSIP